MPGSLVLNGYAPNQNPGDKKYVKFLNTEVPGLLSLIETG